VLLKRGFGSTVEDLLNAAEYLFVSGCSDIILCERGIRTFETATRFTLDISAVPVLKERTKMPVVVDCSHAPGRSELVAPLVRASKAVGADGVMIEVHADPGSALCDSRQQLELGEFEDLMREVL